MDRGSRRLRRGIGAAGGALAFASLLSPVAAAETRTATTSLRITVERHSAIVIQAVPSAVALLSTRFGAVEGPAAAGNGSPTLITVEDVRSLSRAASGKARVAVTVFEP